MSINFPNSPTLNQVFEIGENTYIWNGSQWVGYINLGKNLRNLDDVDPSNLNDGYLMTWNAAASKFIFKNPSVDLGLNNDANPDPNITDYGDY